MTASPLSASNDGSPAKPDATVMKIYFVNIDHWIFPERAQQLIIRLGHQLAGNWLEPNQRGLEQFGPDLIAYAPLIPSYLDSLTAFRLALWCVAVLFSLFPQILEAHNSKGTFGEHARETAEKFS